MRVWDDDRLFVYVFFYLDFVFRLPPQTSRPAPPRSGRSRIENNNYNKVIIKSLTSLLRFQFLTDTIRHYLTPVDFRPGHGELPPERLECRIGHRLVVLRYCRLVVVFALLDHPYDLLGSGGFIRDDHRFAELLRRHQLHVTILVVVHLQLQHALEFGRAGTGRREADVPHRAPPAVPEVLRLELVVLDAYAQRDVSVDGAPVHRAGSVAVVIRTVRQRFDVQHGAPRFRQVIALMVLQVQGLFAQVVEFEALFGARVKKSATSCGNRKKLRK